MDMHAWPVGRLYMIYKTKSSVDKAVLSFQLEVFLYDLLVSLVATSFSLHGSY